MTVRDIMSRPVVIHSSDTIENAIRLMQANQVRSLIVEKCHEDGCYGLLVEKDIVHKVVAPGRDPRHVRVGSLMWPACAQIPLSATVQEAAQFLADAEVSHAPVIESNRLLGIVSVTDILSQVCVAGPSWDQTQAFWQLPQQAYATQDREARIVQKDNEALVRFEDDMRASCKTTF